METKAISHLGPLRDQCLKFDRWAEGVEEPERVYVNYGWLKGTSPAVLRMRAKLLSSQSFPNAVGRVHLLFSHLGIPGLSDTTQQSLTVLRGPSTLNELDWHFDALFQKADASVLLMKRAWYVVVSVFVQSRFTFNVFSVSMLKWRTIFFPVRY